MYDYVLQNSWYDTKYHIASKQRQLQSSHSTKQAGNHHANLPLEMYSFTL